MVIRSLENPRECFIIKITSQPDESESVLTYNQLLSFYLPLAVTPFLIASSHSLVNAAMARLAYPDLSIATFSVVQALANVIKSPGLLARELNVSLVDRTASLRLTNQFLFALAGFYVSILLVFGYTSLGEWFLQTVMGIHDPDVIAFAYIAMRIIWVLPIVEILRNRIQGLSIGLRRTGLVSMGTFVRLIVLALFLAWAVHNQSLTGIYVASVSWVVGIGIEGLFLGIFFKHNVGSTKEAAKMLPIRHEKALTIKTILTFFIPLALMVTLETFFQPYMQSAIARSPVNPTQSLAAYGVAWGLFMLIANPIRGLHQCSLVFLAEEGRTQFVRVRTFCLAIGGCLSGIAFVIGITPIGYWILRYVIGVTEPVAQIGRLVILAFFAYPVLRAWAEFHWGILMGERNTSVIGFAKVLNMGSAIVGISLFIGPLQVLVPLPPAILGGITFTLGQAVESIYLWYYVTKHQRSTVLDIGESPQPTPKVVSSQGDH